MKRNRLILGSLFVLAVAVSKAAIRLPAVISSNMVLQQKSSVLLWGWSEPGEKVVITTSWNNKTDSVKADGNARWQLTVETPAAGGPFTITFQGSNTITLQNVLIGEVWVCSGQSNMEMNYRWGLPQMKEDIPSASNQNIRFFHVPKRTARSPQETGEGAWMLCDSNTVKSFSAVAYYFGRKLNAELNVPIGLVHASWGGTPAEAWTPADVVNSDTVLKAAAQKLNKSNGWPITPGYAYNGMIAPLINYEIAGAIWYQGESNTGTAASYQQLFTAMIKTWREKWNAALPFYFVQLAPFNYGNNLIGAQLREAQTKTLSLSGTGMVVTTDLADDTADIHPRNKRDVGLRLANLALTSTYGKKFTGASSPLYQSMVVNNNEIVLSIANAEGGLQQKGKAATGFFIAGADNVFHPAQVKINGNKLIVFSKAVPQPVAVRYAFSNTAIGNIFSKEGLPLGPFRTDGW